MFDVIYLNETHAPVLLGKVHICAKHNRYYKIELPARKFASAGRFSGGSVVFVKKSYQLSAVGKEYMEWGELIM